MTLMIIYIPSMLRFGMGCGLMGAAVGLSLLVGCGESLPPASEISGLHFTTSTTLPSNPPPAVDVTVGQIPAQAIYAQTLALPDLPDGTYNCPNDAGIQYQLAFASGASTAVTATLDPGGCRTVTFSGSSRVRRVLDDGYWASLAQQLGIPESAIYPVIPQ